MEDYEEDEPDLEEQIFHNNVREQIVSNLPITLAFVTFIYAVTA